MKKFRIRSTGEIVEIISFGNNGSFTEYIDSDGDYHNEELNYFTDFEEIEEPKKIDWEQRRYEIAKQLYEKAVIGCQLEVAADFCIVAANHLIEALKAKNKEEEEE